LSISPLADFTLDDVTFSNLAKPATQVYAAGTLTTDWLLGTFGTVVFEQRRFNVGATGSLAFAPGTVVKLGAHVQINATGPLDILGTAVEPVLFTARDDNSAGLPLSAAPAALAPGAWGWVAVRNDLSTVQHAEFRYGGGVPGASNATRRYGSKEPMSRSRESSFTTPRATRL
jgi:hypothetical protein